MGVKADIIDLLDNAPEKSLEKIYLAAKEILREAKGEKVYTLEEIKNKAVPIAKKYGLKKLSLFGSYARGEADANSDLDFFFDCGKMGGLEYVGLIFDLEDAFKCHVDVVSDGISDKEFLAEIKSCEVLLYAE